MIIFVILPVLGFFYGVRYQQKIDEPLLSTETLVLTLPKKESMISPTNSINANPTPTLKPGNKLFVSKNNDFSFQYPSDWYPEENPEYPGGSNISFFKVGTKSDHGYADHQGNELLSFEYSNDPRTLDSLKKEYYRDAKELTIASKPAILTPFGLLLIRSTPQKLLKIFNNKTILDTLHFNVK
jgi:hypothetical protein